MEYLDFCITLVRAPHLPAPPFACVDLTLPTTMPPSTSTSNVVSPFTGIINCRQDDSV
jgi:hypothetical protein